MKVWCYGHEPIAPDVEAAFQRMLAYLTGAQGQPAWCAWASRAVGSGAFWVADGRAESISRPAEIFIEQIAAKLREIELGLDRNNDCLTLTALLSNDIEYSDFEGTLQEKREYLVRNGIMAGFLHPASRLKTLKSGRAGFPYRAPDVFLTVRRPVEQDIIFVHGNERLTELLADYLVSEQSKDGHR